MQQQLLRVGWCLLFALAARGLPAQQGPQPQPCCMADHTTQPAHLAGSGCQFLQRATAPHAPPPPPWDPDMWLSEPLVQTAPDISGAAVAVRGRSLGFMQAQPGLCVRLPGTGLGCSTLPLGPAHLQPFALGAKASKPCPRPPPTFCSGGRPASPASAPPRLALSHLPACMQALGLGRWDPTGRPA